MNVSMTIAVAKLNMNLKPQEGSTKEAGILILDLCPRLSAPCADWHCNGVDHIWGECSTTTRDSNSDYVNEIHVNEISPSLQREAFSYKKWRGRVSISYVGHFQLVFLTKCMEDILRLFTNMFSLSSKRTVISKPFSSYIHMQHMKCDIGARRCLVAERYTKKSPIHHVIWNRTETTGISKLSLQCNC